VSLDGLKVAVSKLEQNWQSCASLLKSPLSDAAWVGPLQSFVDGSRKRTELISKSFVAVAARFLEVTAYFGTEAPNPQHFFGIIASFKRDLQRAHDENVVQQAAAKKAKDKADALADMSFDDESVEIKKRK
jgi:hypothetical protein